MPMNFAPPKMNIPALLASALATVSLSDVAHAQSSQPKPASTADPADAVVMEQTGLRRLLLVEDAISQS